MRAARRGAHKREAPGFTEAHRDELFRAAHDIKGQAATFGFRSSPVADSLCRLIEHTPDMKRMPLTLIDQHVDAVRAIMRENTRADMRRRSPQADRSCAR